MKTYLKPEIQETLFETLQLLSVSGGDFNLYDTEGDNPFDAAPPFSRFSYE